MSKHPDWLDERIHLDEVPTPLADQARSRREHPDFQTTQAALAASDDQILTSLTPDRFAAEVQRRAASAQRAKRTTSKATTWRGWGSMGLATAIAMFFVFTPQPLVIPPKPDPTVASKPATPLPIPTAPEVRSPEVKPPLAVAALTWRSKGATGLHLERSTASGLVPVAASDSLPAGTVLRLSVPQNLAWATILSLDSRGQMAQHWPLMGDSALPLPAGGLPRTWELDDAPHETFVLVWSDKPFSLNAIRKSVFLHRANKLGSHFQVSQVEVHRPGATR